ncbi:hypothetical protein BKA70DRAFT_1217988 [Coprinopsis sp. MPI-PUGE-AT-0042]|nr:hypothetical protein BKA70DRAFT_1217988 [Coprinopsis sp. MPI-PUGE-AT-0042]
MSHSASLWLKIPLLVASMLGVHVSSTAPASLSKIKAAQSSFVERFFAIEWHFALVKALWWTSTSAEILSIILCYAPTQSSTSARPFEYLQLKGGNLDNLRFTPLFLFGALVTCAGALLRYWCYHLLGDLFTFDITIKKDHRLVSTGPYSIVRHPSYFAGTLNYCGLFLAFAAPGSWIPESGILYTTIGQVTFGALCIFHPLVFCSAIRRIPHFGKEWEQRTKDVPYKLIPLVY